MLWMQSQNPILMPSDLFMTIPCKKGLGVNSYISIVKQKFETIDSAVKLVSKRCYMAKVDLHYAYRSVPVHPSNYHALGLK